MSTPTQRFDAVEALREILGDSPKTKFVEAVGKRLAKLIRRPNPFTASYLYNVLSGAQDAGMPLKRALRAHWMAKNGARPHFAGAYEPIEVKAIPGTVEPGSYVMTDSRRCKNPKCLHPFIRRAPNQLYCDEFCRREARKYYRKD